MILVVSAGCPERQGYLEFIFAADVCGTILYTDTRNMTRITIGAATSRISFVMTHWLFYSMFVMTFIRCFVMTHWLFIRCSWLEWITVRCLAAQSWMLKAEFEGHYVSPFKNSCSYLDSGWFLWHFVYHWHDMYRANGRHHRWWVICPAYPNIARESAIKLKF